MELLLDLGGRGRRRALEDELRAAIRDGRLSPGDRLPSSRTMAAELGLARGTVVDAIAQLAIEGYVQTGQGRRTTVTALAPSVRDAGAVTAATACRHDLTPGTPEPGSFPARTWLSTLRSAVGHVDDDALGYGVPNGVAELRHELSGYLRRARGVAVDPDRVVVCSGFSHGLELLSAALRRTGTARVAMEDPGLWFHREIVASAGLGISSTPVDTSGATVPAAPVGALLVTPAHQFPTGATMASERRRELVAWARDTGSWIVEDDYDGEFRFDRRPIGALQGLDPDHVVYAGTASKALAPGLRLGWLVVPDGLLEPVLDGLRFGTTSPNLDQFALAKLLRSGRFDRHVRRMRDRYRMRLAALMDVVGGHAAIRAASGAPAGLHLLLELPAGSEDAVVSAARARSLVVEGLGAHWHHDRHRDGIVIGFTRPPEHAYRATLETLDASLTDVFGSRR